MSGNQSTAVLFLPGILGPQGLRELRDQILQQRGTDIALDGTNVTRASTLGMQLLLAAAATWAADGKTFALRAPSVALAETASVLGIQPSQLSMEIPSP